MNKILESLAGKVIQSITLLPQISGHFPSAEIKYVDNSSVKTLKIFWDVAGNKWSVCLI